MFKRQQTLIVGLIILTFALCTVITFDLIPALRGPAPSLQSPLEWQWGYISPADVVFSKLILPSGAIALIALWVYLTRTGPVTTRTLIVLVVLALSFRLAVQAATQSGIMIFARTLNPGYFGYFQPAAQIKSLPEFLHDYEQIRETHYRMQSHPPGNVVFYWAVIRATESMSFIVNWFKPILEPRIANLPEWSKGYTLNQLAAAIPASLFVPFLSALSILPIYALTKLIADEQAARLAALVYVFIPALTNFTPVIDDVFCLISATTFYFLVSGLTNNISWRIALAGLIMGIGLFMSFSLIPLFAMLGLTIALHSLHDWRNAWRLRLRDGFTFLITSGAIWLSVWAIFGLNPVVDFTTSIQNQDAVRRAYLPSVFYGWWDLWMFAAMPLAIHWIISVIQAIRRRQSIAHTMTLSVVLTLGLIFTTGSLRGEVARTLLYVFPLITITSAQSIQENAEKFSLYPFILLILMAGQTIVFQSTLAVYH